MYSLHLSAEQLEIRDTIRDFVNQEIKPVTLKSSYLEAFDRPLPVELIEKASQMGLRTLALSEDAGGSGADALTCCLVTEELSVGDVDIAAVLAETSGLARLLFDGAMNAAQRARFVPAFLEDESYHLALATHEDDSDDDLGVNYHRPEGGGRSVKTTATRSGTHWVINGTKDCVANAPLAKLFAVEVKTDRGTRLLMVPHDTPGLAVEPTAPSQGWGHGAFGTLVLKNCQVPVDNMIEGDAAAVAAGHSAAQMAALNVGIGRAAYEAALDYAQLRVQGGRRIIEHQAIGAKLADVAIKLEVSRNAIWHAAWAEDHPEALSDRSLSDLPLATVARVFTAEAMYTAAKDAAECFGAMGVMRDMPLQKYVHDALVCLHSGGGADDGRLRIAEALVGYQRSAPAAAQAAE